MQDSMLTRVSGVHVQNSVILSGFRHSYSVFAKNQNSVRSQELKISGTFVILLIFLFIF